MSALWIIPIAAWLMWIGLLIASTETGKRWANSGMGLIFARAFDGLARVMTSVARRMAS